MVRRDLGHRTDIEGLRALAVLLVVAYHADVPLMGGGFVGIDVFFVITGYLVSRRLLVDADRHHRVLWRSFWASRLRRVVPTLTLVLAATLVGSYVVLPALDLDDVSRQGEAAALYVSNFLFAAEGGRLSDDQLTSSPFLHTWSISVGAQFCLVWPLIVSLACWARRLGSLRAVPDLRRRALIALFGAILVGSFAVNLMLTADDRAMAFFGLPARGWEFAAAGLLATVRIPDWLLRRRARVSASTLGLILIAIAALTIDDTTAYPGLWAVLPVLGTVALIASGDGDGRRPPTPIARYLAVAPLQGLGRVSYSWYLCHWPAIVLLVAAVDDNTTTLRVTAALLSLPVAFLAHRAVERPAQRSPVLTGSRARTLGISVAATVIVLCLAAIVRPDSILLDSPGPLSTDDLEAPPGSSIEERVAVAVERYEERVLQSCLQANPVESEDGDAYCVDGDPAGSTTVLLLGDDDAGQWRAPLAAIAEANGIRLVVRDIPRCLPYAVAVSGGRRGDLDLICQNILEGNLRLLQHLEPDAVVLATGSSNGAYLVDVAGNPAEPAAQGAIWEEGVMTLLEILRAQDIPVGLIQAPPALPFNASDCLVQFGIDGCETPREEAFRISGPLLDAEARAAASLGDVPVFDASELMCDSTTCRLDVDGTLVYVDSQHLTDAFVARQGPALEAFLGDLLS